jgi:hypothetical protein
MLPGDDAVPAHLVERDSAVRVHRLTMTDTASIDHLVQARDQAYCCLYVHSR